MMLTTLPVPEAEGTLLAHSVRFDGGILKKGHRLTLADLATLAAAGRSEVRVAVLDAEDMHEDAAAASLASSLAGDGLSCSPALTGRCNLIAAEDGLLLADAESVRRCNMVDESLTVATLPAFARATAGGVVATIKIIPFAVPKSAVAAACCAARPLHLAPFRRRKLGLILSRVPGDREALVDSRVRVLAQRLVGLHQAIDWQRICDHDEIAVADCIALALEAGCELVLVWGGAATTDRRDVVPSAMIRAGGEVLRMGMPVDPGNLLTLGRVGGVPALGIPTCARSPKLNGFDLVLQRLAAGLAVSTEDIAAMGSGGLLKEIDRPLPRERAVRTEARAEARKVAALVLAAGRSSRMGATNKLMADVDGKPMVARTVDAVLASGAAGTWVITGHEAEMIERTLAGRAITLVRNPDYADGLSTSLRCGLAALPSDVDGVLVCLADMPLITSGDIDRLISAWDPDVGRLICVPTFAGKRGNPIVWPRALFSEMAAVTGDIGARNLLAEHAEDVHEVAVTGRGVLMDVDVPEALAAVCAELADGREAVSRGKVEID